MGKNPCNAQHLLEYIPVIGVMINYIYLCCLVVIISNLLSHPVSSFTWLCLPPGRQTHHVRERRKVQTADCRVQSFNVCLTAGSCHSWPADTQRSILSCLQQTAAVCSRQAGTSLLHARVVRYLIKLRCKLLRGDWSSWEREEL